MKTVYGGNGQCGWLSSGSASPTACTLHPAMYYFNSYRITGAQNRLSWKILLKSSSPAYEQDNRTVALSATFSLSLNTPRDADCTTSPGSPSPHLFTLSVKKFLLMSKVDTAPHFLFPYCAYHSDTWLFYHAF